MVWVAKAHRNSPEATGQQHRSDDLGSTLPAGQLAFDDFCDFHYHSHFWTAGFCVCSLWAIGRLAVGKCAERYPKLQRECSGEFGWHRALYILVLRVHTTRGLVFHIRGAVGVESLEGSAAALDRYGVIQYLPRIGDDPGHRSLNNLLVALSKTFHTTCL